MICSIFPKSLLRNVTYCDMDVPGNESYFFSSHIAGNIGSRRETIAPSFWVAIGTAKNNVSNSLNGTCEVHRKDILAPHRHQQSISALTFARYLRFSISTWSLHIQAHCS